MTGVFRQKNSSNILLLLLYGLALKAHSLLYPLPPLREPDDHYLYNAIMDFLQPLQLSPLVYSMLAFAILFSQAVLFNRVFNNAKMLPKPNYLVGMAFLLISSLFKEWSQFSSPLLINSFLIWAYSRMVALYGSPKPGTAIFNVGLLIGFVTLLYQPAVVFIILILFALYIMRPFRMRDWLIGLLGVTAPYYFLAIFLYLNNSLSWRNLIPVARFSLPRLSEPLDTISISLLVIPFIIGGYLVQSNLSKMLIQVRKNWSLLLIFLMLSTLIILINGGNNYVKWMLCMVPLAGFHAAAYFYPSSFVPQVLHWITFAYAIYINYWL